MAIMKVLMFGWEFPPHITGGLGTACFGMTQSLIQEGVEVLFVVPKLVDSEPIEKLSMVDASAVVIRKVSVAMDDVPHGTDAFNASINASNLSRTSAEDVHSGHMHHATLTQIEVPSSLLPYQQIKPATTITHADVAHHIRRITRQRQPKVYAFANADDADDELTEDHADHLTQEDSFTHQFSGSYGPDLLDETVRYAEVAAAIAQQFEFDIIHCHDWMTFPAGLVVKKLTGKPLVVHVHATEIDRSGETPHPVVFGIEKDGMEGADRVLAVSAWTKQIIARHYHIDTAKIDVVHNGAIPKPIEAVAPIKLFGPHVITFLGRVTYQKGPLYFVKAAIKVLKKFPDAHFVIGGSGDLFPLVLEEVARARISSRFHFPGFLKGAEVDKLWSMSSVYVMPSVSEPFGITPLEAIQAGIPVIVSNQSGVAEVMDHAIKVNFWDTDALASAICNVLAHESLSSTLKKNSKNEVKNITWHKTALTLKSIYHELID